MTEDLIRVLVVDDHEIVRKNIAGLLRREKDIEVIGTAADGREAIELAHNMEPDVIVMDVFMPELDGIRAARAIRDLHIHSRVIILSMHHNTALVQQARKSGVSGYVIKQEATHNLIPAIHAVHDGRLVL